MANDTVNNEFETFVAEMTDTELYYYLEAMRTRDDIIALCKNNHLFRDKVKAQVADSLREMQELYPDTPVLQSIRELYSLKSDADRKPPRR